MSTPPPSDSESESERTMAGANVRGVAGWGLRIVMGMVVGGEDEDEKGECFPPGIFQLVLLLAAFREQSSCTNGYLLRLS